MPFSIKSGISTASQGANWKMWKSSMKRTLNHINKLENSSPLRPSRVLCRTWAHSSPTTAWNGRSSKSSLRDTFSPSSRPVPEAQSQARWLGKWQGSRRIQVWSECKWREGIAIRSLHQMPRQTRIWGDCGRTSTCRTTWCPPCSTRDGTSPCPRPCCSGHTGIQGELRIGIWVLKSCTKDKSLLWSATDTPPSASAPTTPSRGVQLASAATGYCSVPS